MKQQKHSLDPPADKTDVRLEFATKSIAVPSHEDFLCEKKKQTAANAQENWLWRKDEWLCVEVVHLCQMLAWHGEW